jgi:phosphatidylglycerol:prolipoprotein diacylglycerol transferase
MHPVLFEVFGYPISTFGVMMAVGFLVAAWNTGVRLREHALDPEWASTLLLYAMVGGIVGSKLYFAVDEGLRTGAPFAELLLSRSGITWYGGLIGGTLAVAAGARIHGLGVRVVSSCVSVAAALGQACGRIGCFLVGDDYGRPTALAWGVAFPEGSPPVFEPVHPTQLYEAAWLLAAAALLWRRRHASPFLFGEYLALNGAGRFAIEFLRINPPLALGLTQPQWIGIALVLLGGAGWLYHRTRRQPAPARA